MSYRPARSRGSVDCRSLTEALRGLRSRGQWFDGPVVLTDSWRVTELMRELGYPAVFLRGQQCGVAWSPLTNANVLAHLRSPMDYREMLLEIRAVSPDPFDVFCSTCGTTAPVIWPWCKHGTA